MAKDASVAPKERVNIVYKSHTGDKVDEVELPLKLLMVGDYTGRASDEMVEDRPAKNINKDNFNDVMKSYDLNLNFTVANKLEETDEDEQVPVELKFKDIKDFSPDSVAQQVPELKALLDLRKALLALKGPLGNVPAFRKTIQSILSDETTRSAIEGELGL
ncbi:MAG: type VI secretion system contractile sheath small subunit [Saccharospirillaceae bacterium]|nr:type VI secretion system contractile sheath small subunit [Pseudomonadales bacterium]NRB81229.1 type VI secretion system contractile sheath small subunit [Saccharospirillaceae bacterium]